MLLLFYHVCPAGASAPGAAPEILRDADLEHYPYPVSYTHLTLPTILLV